MADKAEKTDKADKVVKADKKKKKEDSALVGAAEAIGATVGKIAALVGVGGKPATAPKAIKIPKLAKKGKSRLPRKEKKAQQKAQQKADEKAALPATRQ
jgi:hypothetical protein